MTTTGSTRRALLLLDPTVATVRPEGSFAKRMDPHTDFTTLTHRMRTALTAARKAGASVLWIVPSRGLIERMSGRVPDPEELYPDEIVGVPAADEPVVKKTEIGAFAGTKLESTLRDRGVDEIVLVGVATQYVVAATAREGSERGFAVRVLEDACADVDPAAHARTLDELRPIATIGTATTTAWG